MNKSVLRGLKINNAIGLFVVKQQVVIQYVLALQMRVETSIQLCSNLYIFIQRIYQMATINVCVRMRPYLAHQRNQRTDKQRIYLLEQAHQVKVELTENKDKYFKFNNVFTQQYSQQEVYEGVEAKSLVERVLDGYHSTIFAYGQTGSGKTYTIDGDDDSSCEGIIPRSIKQLFQMLQKKNGERDYKIFLSFIQIYNEGIYDLIDLNDGRPLKMRWNKHQQFTVENMFEGQCRSAEQALKWWKKGQKNKIIGAHKMNNASSRSHCILTLKVNSFDLEDPSDKIESKLQIVDLAGSQRQKVTKSTGVIFKEGVEINKSLFTLRQVIAALYESSTSSKLSNDKVIPPYRDSKLTSLLKQSIGGNSYCVMIACINPTFNHFEESLQTLTYASMASYISNIPIKNIDPKIQQNEQLKDQNNQLKIELKKMSEHIEYLTKLLQNNECLECKKKSNVGNRKTQSEGFQRQEGNQPTGLINFPKLNEEKTSTMIDKKSSVALNSPTKHEKNYEKILNDKSVVAQKKQIKSTKDIMESINMIKDLISANATLRQKIEGLKNYIEKQEKQTYALMKENQVLRDRWDLVNGSILPQVEAGTIDEAPIAAYERLIKQQKGQGNFKSNSYYSNQMKNESQQQSNKISYNDFLKGKKKDKKENNLMNRKRNRLYSQSRRNQDSFVY